MGTEQGGERGRGVGTRSLGQSRHRVGRGSGSGSGDRQQERGLHSAPLLQEAAKSHAPCIVFRNAIRLNKIEAQ